MLNIIVFDRSKQFVIELAKSIKSLSSHYGYNMDIKLLALKPEKILDSTRPEEKYFFILEMQPEHLSFYKKIRSEYSDAYLTFTTEKFELLAPVIHTSIMPSGFVIKPLDIKMLKILLADVYNDYMNRWGSAEGILSVNIGVDIYKVSFDEIIYIEALNKKVNVITRNCLYSYYDQMQRLEKKLAGKFIRSHRGYLVNVNKIKNILFSEMQVEMANKAKIPISRGYKHNLQNLSDGDDATHTI